MTNKTRPLRLAIVLPYVSSLGGGVTEAVRLLAHALARRDDFEIEIISFASEKDAEALKDWPDLPHHAFQPYGPKNYCFAPGMAAHMLRNCYDVVHCHGIWMFHVFPSLLAMWRGARAVVSPHGMLEKWILARSAKLKWAVSTLYQNRALRRADVLHALTLKEVGDIAAYLPGEYSVVVPNFVPQPPAVDHDAPWLTAEMKDRKVFLFLGRIHDKKGWRELVAAWRLLCGTRPELRDTGQLVFCGWVDQVPDFETEIAAAGTELGNVIYAGPQFGDDKTASYEAANVFLLPSHSEGLPMVILEAVNGGALVAMSEGCNLPGFFERGAAVETGTDAETIAAALERLLDMSDEEQAAMRAAATAEVSETYSEEAVVSAFADLYKQGVTPSGGATGGSANGPLAADAEHSIFTGAPSFSLAHRMRRALFMLVWGLLASWTPPPLHKWRIAVLRMFGAEVDWSCKVYGSAKVWYPPNLVMEPFAVMGPGVQCYNQDRITIGRYAIVSQRAHLCSGTHEIASPAFQLITRPVVVGRDSWVCAEAFVGPGVTVGEGAVLGARAVATRSLDPWMVYRGNPAEALKPRPRFDRDAG